jgi:hypothetical protein
MMMRRDFLRIAGATPLIVGLDRLFAQDNGIPTWYADALKRMKETRRQGLVIVVPEEAGARELWSQALLALLDADHNDAREIFGIAVVVCVTPEIAAKTVRAAGSKDNRFLLDTDGKALSSSTIDLDALKLEVFVKSSQELLLGDRLKAAADAIAKDAPDSVRTALDKLGGESLEARDEARGVLEAKADAIFPLLVWMRITTKSQDVRHSIAAVIKGWTTSRGDSRVPFGAKIEKLELPINNCGPCGKVVARPAQRRFLSFLAK